MKLKYFGFLFLILIVCSTYSQEIVYGDVIVLKNGTEIQGQIVHASPGRYFTIEKSDGKRVNIYMADVLRVIKASKKSDTSDAKVFVLEQKFHTLIEPGIQYLTNDIVYNLDNFTSGKFVYFSAYLVNSLVLKKNSITMGLGTGIETLPQAFTIPVFLDFRKYFGRGNVMGFIIGDAGYNLGLQKPDANLDWVGLFYEPAVGLLFRNRNFMDFTFRIGYKHQNFKVRKAYKTKNMSTDFITLKIGLFF